MPSRLSKTKVSLIAIKTLSIADVMFCAIWYYLYNLKNVKNTHGRVSLLVQLHAFIVCNFTKSSTPPWVFFTFFKCTNGTKSRNAAHTVYLRCPLYSNLISLLFHFIMSLDVSVKLNKVSFFWLVSNSFTPHVTVPN